PAGRLGLAPERGDCRSRDPGSPHSCPRATVCRRPDSPPRALGRIPSRPHGPRVLARAAQPAARPAAVHPKRRRLAHRAAVAVISFAFPEVFRLRRPTGQSTRWLTYVDRVVQTTPFDPAHLRDGPGVGWSSRSQVIDNQGNDPDVAQADRDGTGSGRHAGDRHGYGSAAALGRGPSIARVRAWDW